MRELSAFQNWQLQLQHQESLQNHGYEHIPESPFAKSTPAADIKEKEHALSYTITGRQAAK